MESDHVSSHYLTGTGNRKFVLLWGVSIMHSAAVQNLLCMCAVCNVWWRRILVSGTAGLNRYSSYADTSALLVTTAWDVVMPGNEVTLWVWLIDVCVATLIPQGWLTIHAYDWLPAFGLLTRNFFCVSARERLFRTISSYPNHRYQEYRRGIGM